MDRNESEQWISEHTTNMEEVESGRLPHHDEACLPEKQNPESP
jgi:hypothetical protein